MIALLAAFPRRIFKQIHQAALVGIAHRGFAVWQNPIGMLSPKVVMNLLPEVRDCLDYSHNYPVDYVR
jgi:hypothetical protein